MDEVESISIFDVRIHRVNVHQLLGLIEKHIDSGPDAIIAYVNVHAMNLAYELPWFRNFFNSANVVFCDGFGVAVGARLIGLGRLARLTPPDWMAALCKMCVNRDFSMYFLGGRPGVAEKAATHLRSETNGVRIVGTHHGYFDKRPESGENLSVIERVNSHSPSILWLGFGMPLQERWILENRERLNARVIITGGAIFDYISGEIRRGPKWLTESGFEWLTRLIIEPKRLWRRYIVGNPLFFLRILKDSIRRD